MLESQTSNIPSVLYWLLHVLQMMQTAFIEKTAQLQALQQQLTGQQHASPELIALHQDMLDAQVLSSDKSLLLSVHALHLTKAC